MKSIHRPLIRAAQLAAFAFPATVLAQTPLPGSFTSLTTTDNILSTGTFGTSPVITTAGAGTRMMWYPRKAAFRAGGINGTQWNDAFIGNYSAAFGNNTRATGGNSTAFGLNSIATGTNSTAFGANSKASAGQATAFGNGVTASGDSSTALGIGTSAAAMGVTALGRFNTGAGSATTWVETDALFEIGNGTSNTARKNALTVLKNGNTSISGTLSTGGALIAPSISTTGALTASSISTTNLSAATITSTGSINAANITSGGKNVVTANADGVVNLKNSQGGESLVVDGQTTIKGNATIEGSPHLASKGQAIEGLTGGLTGSYFGPIKTGANSQQIEYLFEITGNETTADAILPLGLFANWGGQINIEVSTPFGDPDSGSASFAIVGKLHNGNTYLHGDLSIIEHQAAGGAENIQIFGKNSHGSSQLFVKFDAKGYNWDPNYVWRRQIVIKVTLQGNTLPNEKWIAFEDTFPLQIVDSTTRANNGPMVKSITADQIKLSGQTTLSGAVTLSQAQGDIAMGIFE